MRQAHCHRNRARAEHQSVRLETGTQTLFLQAHLTAGGNGLAYDPAGRLYERSANASRYLYSGGQAIGRYDASGAVVDRYVPGAGLDDYAAYVTASGARTWPFQDPLGSVAALMNSSGAATQINAYDEYGVPASGFSGPFGYAGSMHLSEASAAPWFMRNRQYPLPSAGSCRQTRSGTRAA